jgi:hypothetical protein
VDSLRDMGTSGLLPLSYAVEQGLNFAPSFF